MTQAIRRTLLIAVASLIIQGTPAVAQTDLRVSVADIKQDLATLIQQVKTLRLEVEQLRTENARLSRAQAGDNTRGEVLAAIENLRSAYLQADAVQKQTILAEVNRQMQALAKETQTAIQAVAGAIGSQPSTPARLLRRRRLALSSFESGEPHAVTASGAAGAALGLELGADAK